MLSQELCLLFHAKCIFLFFFIIKTALNTHKNDELIVNRDCQDGMARLKCRAKFEIYREISTMINQNFLWRLLSHG